jgi:hypothetical protein
MQTFVRNLSTFNVQWKLTNTIMSEVVLILVKCTEIVLILTKVNNTPLGKGPNTALSIDSDCDPAANVNVLTSTFVK